MDARGSRCTFVSWDAPHKRGDALNIDSIGLAVLLLLGAFVIVNAISAIPSFFEIKESAGA